MLLRLKVYKKTKDNVYEFWHSMQMQDTLANLKLIYKHSFGNDVTYQVQGTPSIVRYKKFVKKYNKIKL